MKGDWIIERERERSYYTYKVHFSTLVEFMCRAVSKYALLISGLCDSPDLPSNIHLPSSESAVPSPFSRFYFLYHPPSLNLSPPLCTQVPPSINEVKIIIRVVLSLLSRYHSIDCGHSTCTYLLKRNQLDFNRSVVLSKYIMKN